MINRIRIKENKPIKKHGVQGNLFFYFKSETGEKHNLLDWQTNSQIPKKNFKIGNLTHNLTYFGAPGTGKSYTLKHEAENGYFINIERVTFHSDYSYANFVGCYKPVSDEKGNIKYQYVMGPFLRILKESLNNPNYNYLLIIEEINRANMAAVFGDIFQLLDRDDEGKSTYSINISDEMKTALDISERTIKIPSNMYIWATMNSADQGVFPMDTAFKRRWNFQYLDIDSGQEDISGIIINLTLNNITQSVNWNDIRMNINNRLTDCGVNEDKLLGAHFLDKSCLTDEKFKESFKNKVIMYLFKDAARQKRKSVFSGCEEKKVNRFSDICNKFEEIGMGIFGFNENQ